MCRSFIFQIAIFIAATSYAQHPPVRNFNRQTTKGGTQNWDIIQHSNDWMYFANNEGLLEFDGNRWAIYPIGNYTNVRSLYYDRHNDRIYAGAFNEFGYYARDDRGMLNYFSLVAKVDSLERNFNEIWNIVNVDNALFFQGGKEIFRYKDDRIKRFHFLNKVDCISNVHNSLFVSSFVDGISILNGDLFFQLPNSSIMKNKKVCAILPFDANQILFVTDFHGLFIFDGEKVVPFVTDIDDFLRENQVFCACINESKLAIGTVRNGLVVKDLRSNTCIYSNVRSELQNNTVLSLAFDKQQNLWLGLDKGVDYVMINSPVYDLFGNNQLYGAGYTSIIKDNFLYLGTNQGLYSTSYPLARSSKQSKIAPIANMQGQVWCLEMIDGVLFCGTDHGAFVINGNEVVQLKKVPGTWGFKELKSHPGYILGSSYQGFFMLKKESGKWIFSHFVKGFDESGGMFEEDENGYIWFSHWIKGFSKLVFNETLDRFSVEAFDVSKGFYTERNSVLFKINNKIIFSSDGGFFEYSKPQNKVVHSPEIEQIFGILPHSIRLFESPRRDIWNVSSREFEIAFIQPDHSYVIKKAFYPSLNNKLIAGFRHLNFISDSIVIINTEDGFSWLDFSKINKQTSDSLKVSIRHLYFTNKDDSIVGGFQTLKDDVPEFKYKYNSIRFEFSAPEYANENSVRYSCYLENYDSDWSAYSLKNTKEYTKLPKGNYIFRVKARKASDDNVVETYYQFAILPPWYETWVAKTLYVILLFFCLIQLLRFIKKRSERRLREMKAQKEKEIEEQKERFDADAKEKEKEIIALKNQRMQYDLRHKSKELASSTMNLIRKNEMLLELNLNLAEIANDIKNKKEPAGILNRLSVMEQSIKKNIERDDNWRKFEENFDLVYENYLKRLGEQFTTLTVSEKKLCAYLRMGLRSKDIAPLLNMSYRSVEMSRYRLRKKIGLVSDTNLTEFLQNF